MKDFERHQLATELGFQYDPETSSIYGENSGYLEKQTQKMFLPLRFLCRVMMQKKQLLNCIKW